MTAQSHRFQLGVNAIVFTVIVVAALVAVNVLAGYFHGRADLTQDGIYSLSSVSKDLVKKDLKSDLRVRVFVSRKLVAGLQEVYQYLTDLLEQYAASSNGKFRWEVVHPDDSAKNEELVKKYNIPKVDAQTKQSGSKESREIYFGIAITYKKPGAEKEETEVIPVVGWNMQGNLEYLISERIHRLVKGKKKIVIVTGHDEIPAQQVQDLIKALGQSFKAYDVDQWNVKTGEAPKDAAVALVFPPKNPWDDAGRKKLNAFLLKGKGALLFIEGMAPQQPKQQFQMPQMKPFWMPASHGMNELLKKWGVEIEGNLVLDEGQQPLLIQQGQQAQLIYHPALLNIRISNRIKAPVTPFLASSLKLTQAYLGEKIQPGKSFRVQPLLVSSPKAWTVTGPYSLDLSRRDKAPEGATRGSYVVGALIEGKLPSAYPEDTQAPKQGTDVARVAVFGDFDLFKLSRAAAGNQILIQNLVDWAAQEESLVKLRNKQMQERALTLPESKAKRVGIQIANVLGLPLLLVAIGLVRWQLRARRRRRAQESLNS
jgi:gliding-associated putative ABC transporter substrate-binding component GldG